MSGHIYGSAFYSSMQIVCNETELLQQLHERDIKAQKCFVLAYGPAAMDLVLSQVWNTRVASEIVSHIIYEIWDQPGLLNRYVPPLCLQEALNVMVYSVLCRISIQDTGQVADQSQVEFNQKIMGIGR